MERNITVWSPLVHSLLGTWSTIQARALTGNQTGDPLLRRPKLDPLSHTSQFSQILIYFLTIAPPFGKSYICYLFKKKERKERKKEEVKKRRGEGKGKGKERGKEKNYKNTVSSHVQPHTQQRLSLWRSFCTDPRTRPQHTCGFLTYSSQRDSQSPESQLPQRLVSPGTWHGCPRHEGLGALQGGPVAGQRPAGSSVLGTAPGRGRAERCRRVARHSQCLWGWPSPHP